MTLPLRGGRRPAKVSARVVFPDPFGPVMIVDFPCGISIKRFVATALVPYPMVRSWVESIGLSEEQGSFGVGVVSGFCD
jgi:hypothetical protein